MKFLVTIKEDGKFKDIELEAYNILGLINKILKYCGDAQVLKIVKEKD